MSVGSIISATDLRKAAAAVGEDIHDGAERDRLAGLLNEQADIVEAFEKRVDELMRASQEPRP